MRRLKEIQTKNGFGSYDHPYSQTFSWPTEHTIIRTEERVSCTPAPLYRRCMWGTVNLLIGQDTPASYAPAPVEVVAIERGWVGIVTSTIKWTDQLAAPVGHHADTLYTGTAEGSVNLSAQGLSLVTPTNCLPPFKFPPTMGRMLEYRGSAQGYLAPVFDVCNWFVTKLACNGLQCGFDFRFVVHYSVDVLVSTYTLES